MHYGSLGIQFEADFVVETFIASPRNVSFVFTLDRTSKLEKKDNQLCEDSNLLDYKPIWLERTEGSFIRGREGIITLLMTPTHIKNRKP